MSILNPLDDWKFHEAVQQAGGLWFVRGEKTYYQMLFTVDGEGATPEEAMRQAIYQAGCYDGEEARVKWEIARSTVGGLL